MKIDSSPLVSTEWLAAHLHDPSIRIVDVRWRSRYENGRGISFDDYDGYLAGHIPGAVFVGMIGDLSDGSSPVPDMLVPPQQFAEVMGRLGIGDDTLVVAYDNMGLPLGSARLWWALSSYGHDRVGVLDGGLREWQSEQRALSTCIPAIEITRFTPRPRREWLATKEDVLAALGDTQTTIVDCLSSEQYRGDGEHHLWGQRAGHIPGAVNVPALANVDPALASVTSAEREQLLASGRSFRFSSLDTLSSLYQSAGVLPERRVITYCGRGYAAACGLLALKVLGYENVRLYDGSWAEWSTDPTLPVEVGASS
jgi:thiosulfate/3-mercaptopyruvate sulfurtransferase